MTLIPPFAVSPFKSKFHLLYLLKLKGALRMKINCHADPNISEERGELWIKKITPTINELLQKLTQSDNSLCCH